MKRKIMLVVVLILVMVPLDCKIFDPSHIDAGYEYNYWNPMKLNGLKVNTFGFHNAYVELRYVNEELIKAMPFIPQIPQMRLETNFNNKYHEELLEMREQNEKDKYLRFLSILSFKIAGKKIRLKYEHEDFISEVETTEDIYYAPRDFVDENDLVTLENDSQLNFKTSFESYGAGYWDKDEKGDFYAGFFYTNYKKPYFITFNEQQINNLLFYSEFRAIGLEGFRNFTKLPGFRRSEVGAKLGIAKILLVNGADLESVVQMDEDKGIAYWEPYINLAGDLRIGGSFFMNYELLTSYRIFYLYDKESGETDQTIADNGFNNDLIVKPMISLKYNF